MQTFKEEVWVDVVRSPHNQSLVRDLISAQASAGPSARCWRYTMWR